MKLYKRNGVYHYKFMNKGRRFRGTTDLSNLKDATTAANKIRNAVVLGDLGILERGPAPSLKAFIEKQFLPYVVSRHAEKPKTLDYYKYGAGQLAGSKIGSARLDSITDKDIAGYIEEHCDWSASGINQGLRTLRRAMNLAYAWGVIGRRLAVRLCAGEKQRTRVLTVEEERAYLGHCREPWRTMATVLIELGLRPGEAFRLKAQDVLFGEFTLRISGGKSKAAKRELPLTDAAYTALEAWWKSIGSPKDGWMFPSPSREGKPYAQQRAHDWHHAALKASGVVPFEPYCLRHTALTRLADGCPDPFAIVKIAGHSSITMTQRYIHPQKDAIRRAFEEKSGHKIGHAARLDRMRVVNGAQEEGDK